MATTSGNLTAGTTTSGGSRQNGIGGRFGLRARVAAGVATLGCAAALAIGGLGVSDTSPSHSRLAPAAPVIQANTMITYEQRRFLEQNQLPEGLAMIAAPTYEQRRFLEQNELPTDVGAAGASGEGYTTGSALPTIESAEFRGTGYTER